MLLPSDQSPWNCSYALGAVALKSLTGVREQDLHQLQNSMASIIGRTVSPTQTLLAVAWLFLIEKVAISENGAIQLCD